MVAFSFRQRFVDPIKAGLGLWDKNYDPPPPKNQTIRAERRDSRLPKVGDMLQLYSGMRTKGCLLIGLATCTGVSKIALVFDDDDPKEGDGVISPGFGIMEWGFSSLDSFARGDGFKDWSELRKFWRQEHPGVDMFEGVIIFWKPLTDEQEEKKSK